jgi:hypothetical protein
VQLLPAPCEDFPNTPYDRPFPPLPPQVQRLLDSEKASHAAAKARIKATHSTLAADAAPTSPRGDANPAREAFARETVAAARESADLLQGVRAELAAALARETQAKNRLAHVTASRQADKAKLER